MPEYSLNWTVRSSAIQGLHRGKKASRPPEGGPTEVGGLSASNLPSVSIPHPTRMPDGQAKGPGKIHALKHALTHALTYTHTYIYICNHQLYIVVVVVESNPKASFTIATTSRCRGGHYSFPWIAPLYPWSAPYNAECYAKRQCYIIISDSCRNIHIYAGYLPTQW